ncbi:MAG: hypothetical protein NZ898_00125 [Myxococcota bacterium]|nr:hypothetical protein [Myxococcota bacterium]MDW8361690.1 hypothetical protein [Myxococcales bacterium]
MRGGVATGWRVVALVGTIGLVACRADPDDPAGQAGELADPLRRQNAIANLHRIYTGALAQHNGDRARPELRAIVDASIDKLVQCYIDNPQDTQNGLHIINLLYEMRDPRAIPALVRALDWRAEVNEEHAIRAAQTIRFLQVPENRKGEVVEALSNALDRVSGARAIDNRMRIEFLHALGALRDRRATPVLVKIATAQSENQNFLINRLAAQKLGMLADPASVPALIRCLFLFAPGNPALRMNDVAAEALVRIGRPAFEPLLAVLRGQDAEAEALAAAYIEAVRARDARAAALMNPARVRSAEATFALGALGFREALEPLLAESQVQGDVDRHVYAAIALVRLNLEPGDLPRVREALTRVFGEANLEAKPQLLAAMRMLYDPELTPFFLRQAADRDLHPAVRLEAVLSYALLADRAQAAELRAFIQREPPSEDGGYRENFARNEPALAAATECNDDVACWARKVRERPTAREQEAREAQLLVVRKACYMLGRYGRGNEAAVAALTEMLDAPDLEVRLAALTALDRIAVRGSQAAIDKIERLRETEEGRSIWTNFSREALPVQARLRNRMAQGG